MRPDPSPFRNARRGVVAVLIASSAPALAQPTVPYEAVDPGVADTTALGDSLRLVPVDLRTPTGFDRVFRLPTVVGGEMFARIDGGVTAVFPRSEYGFGRALIPAGTTWYIGALPSDVFGRPSPRGSTPRVSAIDGAINARLDLRAPAATDEPDPPPPVARPAPTLHPLMPWAGELDRGARVAGLLERAARAERAMRSGN